MAAARRREPLRRPGVIQRRLLLEGELATRRYGIVLLLLSFGASAPCTRLMAQVPRVHPASVVRVRAPRVLPSRIQGMVVDVTRDSLTVMPESGTSTTIALTAITTLDIRAGSNHGEGALIGGVSGRRQWAQVKLPLDVALDQASGAPALRLSIRF